MEADGDLEVKLVPIGNASACEHFSGALQTTVLRVPTEGASAAIYEINTKHQRGTPPGKAHGIHADDWTARAVRRNRYHQRRIRSNGACSNPSFNPETSHLAPRLQASDELVSV